MPDPIITSALISAGGGLLGKFFGDDDEFKMSPEQRKVLNRLMGELEAGNFGFTASEKANMRKTIARQLTEAGEKSNVQRSASLRRRGISSSEIEAASLTDTSNILFDLRNQAETDIEVASAREGRRRKGELERLTLSASQGQFQQGNNEGLFGDIGGASENIMSILLRRGGGAGTDDFELPPLRRPRRPRFNPGPLRQ